MRASRLAIALVLLAGCGFHFPDRSAVATRRVLAMQAEPPELIADGSPLPSHVQVSALVVDPKADGGAINYQWRSCTAGLSGAGNTEIHSVKGEADPTTGRCDDNDPDTLVLKDSKPLPELSDSLLNFPIPASLGPVLAAAGARGYAISAYVIAQLEVDATPSTQYALKRIVVSPALPKGRVANHNPHLAAVLFDDQPWPADGPVAVKVGSCADDKKVTIPDPNDDSKTIITCQHKITPAYDPSEDEPYSVQQFDGTPLSLKEHLRFAWYADQGSFSDSTTEENSGVGPALRDPISTQWQEPADGTGTVNLWVVVRDGRGGESWAKRQLVLSP